MPRGVIDVGFCVPSQLTSSSTSASTKVPSLGFRVVLTGAIFASPGTESVKVAVGTVAAAAVKGVLTGHGNAPVVVSLQGIAAISTGVNFGNSIATLFANAAV